MGKGMMLLEEVMSILLVIAVGAIVIISFANITSRMGQSKEESQARSTLNSLYNFLSRLDENPRQVDEFIIYAPQEYYFSSYDKTVGKFTECYGKNCVCLCKDIRCEEEKKRFCRELDKPLKFEGRDISEMYIGTVQLFVRSDSGQYTVLSSLVEAETPKSVIITTKPGIDVDMSYKPLYSVSRDTSKIDMIVLHHTEGTTARGAYETLVKRSPISVHYIIDRDGRIYYVVDETRKAFHAGEVNYRSIGIEIVSTGCSGKAAGYTEQQYAAVKSLIHDIAKRWPGINVDNYHIIGHFQTEQGRRDGKVDPSGFDWAKVGLHSHPTSPESCPPIFASA